MPTYEYYCASNGQTIEVLHGMNENLVSWGALCARAETEVGSTPPNATVERKLSAVSLLPKKEVASTTNNQTGVGGCCGGGGGGCGCRGH